MPKRLTPVSRKLRRNRTDAELKLWAHLRSRRLAGAKFRQQAPVGQFIADFLCEECRLIIELDGGQHSENAKDEERTQILQAHGYTVIRFWNNEVMGNLEGVLGEIARAVATARGG